MQNRLSAKNIPHIRLVFSASVFLSLILLAIIVLTPASWATREVVKAKATNQKRTKPEFVPGEVLVRYRSEKAAQRQPRAAMVQAEGRAIEMQVQRFGGSDIVEGLRMGRVAAPDTLQAIAALKSQPDVLYAEPNYVLHKDTLPNDPRFPELYGLRNTGQTGGTPGADIHAEQAWSITTGSRGIVVGVIDEGIDINHPDLRDNIWTNPAEIPGNGIDDDGNGFIDDINGWDFYHDDNSVFDGAADPNNQTDAHGTHVAGTIGAVGNNGIGVVGVNWQVSLMSLKFLGPDGGSNSDAIRALSYATNMRDTWVSTGGAQGANVRVLNNSYGGGGFSQAFLDAINAAGNSGILFVAAAGNDGTDNDLQPHYPSNFQAPNVVAVAASDGFDNLSTFSNFGADTVHIAAPGTNILSTKPNNTYGGFSGTSMATPHVSGGAALICAANPNVTIQQLKGVLIFNGDTGPALAGKSLTERRLNVARSLQALAENDVTAPGTVANFRISSQSGRNLNLAWTASGDDGANGQASLYQVSFTDADTGATVPLKNIMPPASGSPQTLDVNIPYRHTNGTMTLREFDNAGNEGIPASLTVSTSLLDGDPYATMLGNPAALSTGGARLGLADDEGYQIYVLPFSFPFFSQNFSSVIVSTNGALYFSSPPFHDFVSSAAGLAKFKMIAGLWDDLDLSTSQRADAGVYVVQPDSNRIIFRWQSVPCNYNQICRGGDPVNFEIELQNNGNIETRYGSYNTGLFPVMGISGGEREAYVIPTHTSEAEPLNLTNAQSVTFASRAASLLYTISGHVEDDSNIPLNNVTITFELDSQGTTTTASTDANGNYSFSGLGCPNSLRVTPSKTGYSFNPPSLTLGSTGCVGGSNTANFSAIPPPPNTVQFSSANYSVGEGGASVTINVRRSGDASRTLSVNYQTNDSPNVGCNINNGQAKQGCDYFATAGTLNFAANEASKTFSIPIINDSQFEGNETINLSLSNPAGGSLGSQNTVLLTITDDDIIKPEVRYFIAQLNGLQETPANSSTATGVATLLLSADETTAQINLSFNGLSSDETAAHIQGAAPFAQSAPVIFPLPNGTVINQTINLTPDQVQQLKQGLFYFNVRTNNLPEGEIRGQILPDPTDGTVLGFDPGANGNVTAFAVQLDGKILVAGYFTTMGGGGTGTITRDGIARLNHDGTLDTSFDPRANSSIDAIALQPDGKILVGGSFTTLGGGGTGTVTRNHIARLNADGTVDMSFDPGANGEFVLALAVQPDGKILVGGNFTTLGGGGAGNTPRHWIGRLNLDGTVDNGFDPGANGASHFGNNGVLTFAIQADGKILVGGDFSILGGGGLGTTTRRYFGRLNADGTLDTSFDPGVGFDKCSVYALVLQADGKILVAGNFDRLGGGGTGTTSRKGIGRFNADGTLDMSFDPGSDESVATLAMQADGKILVGGDFTKLGGGGFGTITRNHIGRLNSDGTVDLGFDPGAGPYFVGALAVQPNGKILVGGEFTTLGGGGLGTTIRNHIGRLNVDGTVDYTPPTGAPIVSNLSPSSAIAGGSSFTLTVNGGGFVAGSLIRVNGFDRTSAFVDSTHLSTTIEATEIVLAGPLSVTVTNPDGGTSNPVSLTVNNPLPTVSALSPNSKRTGDPAFQLTVNGTNFNSRSIVRLGGFDRPTTLVNSTQLIAQIGDSDIAEAGNLSITVFNQTPAGGISSALGFTVYGLRAPSAVDGFDPGANGPVSVLAVQPDGRILVGGSFTAMGGGGTGTRARNHLARLNADGTLDASFDPGTNGNSVNAIAMQADGKILVGGNFSKLGGGGTGTTTRNNIGRLNADGTLDTTFNSGANAPVFGLALRPDGKIVVVGNFTTLGGGGSGSAPRNFIGRLNGDGSLDESFDPGANSPVEHLALQPDGRILVSGNFSRLGGGGSGTVPRYLFGRLNSDGSIDTTFDPGSGGKPLAFAVQGDGKILVGGFFDTLGGGGSGTITRYNIGRLKPNGELDTAFDPGANNAVYALAMQPDGKILLGGSFTKLGGGGSGNTPRNHLGRLNPDGTLDTTFDPGANSNVSTLALQSDGKILLGGVFTTLGGGGTGTTQRNRMGRLNADGTLDQDLTTAANGAVFALAVQADEKILLGGAFTTLAEDGTVENTRNHIGRLKPDGTVDMSFDPGANGTVNAVAFQPDGKILVAGTFTTLGGGGTGTATRNHIGRLNSNGTLDSSFDPGANDTVIALALQPDGKILIGGNFTTLGGGGTGTSPRNFLGRLNADGTLDAGFNPIAGGSVSALALQADGKILVGGSFEYLGSGLGSATHKHVGRLNPDGTVDTGFVAGTDLGVGAIIVQPDGKILIGGDFNNIEVPLAGGGTTTTFLNRLARLNADGTLDLSFNPGTDGTIAALAIQADGKILVGGGFSRLGGGGAGTTACNHIGRLNVDGSLDLSFDPGANQFVTALALQADGKILAGGHFTLLGGGGTGTVTSNFIGRLTNTEAAIQSLTSSVDGTTLQWLRSQASPELARVTFELSTDGLTYSQIGNGTRVADRWQLSGLTLAAYEKFYVRARGFYATGYQNGSGSIVESVTLIAKPASSTLPIVTSLSPSSVMAGNAGFNLTINGAGFLPGFVIRINDVGRATTFGDSTHLTTQIDASEIAFAGSLVVRVFDPAPSGGQSLPLAFAINNPVPTITSLQPSSVTAGGPAFTLTVNGANFIFGSVVRFNGANRATTFVSSTELTATILAADLGLARSYPVTVLSSAPGGGTSNSVNFAVNPSITSISPTNVRAGDLGFTLTVNGAGFVIGAVVQFNGVSRPTSYGGVTKLTTSILAADIATVGTYPITVVTAAPASLTSNAVNLTVHGPTVLSASNSSGSANSTVTVPIQMTAYGDEHALSFSLAFDTALLMSSPLPQVSPGSGLGAATLTTDSSQLAFGRLGITLTLPVGQTFAAGALQVVSVSFATAAVGTQATTPVAFADQPMVRQVSNLVGQSLSVTYNPGTVTITPGYECDVDPRPNGSNDGNISIADWVQAGRFAAGLDTPNPGSEFQRADCSPRETLGNGAIGIADWVQAGRYAAGLESVMAAGGPTGPTGGPSLSAAQIGTESLRTQGTEGAEAAIAETTRVNLESTLLPDIQSSTVSIEFDAQGNENAFGFSLLFDPTRMRFVSAEKSGEASDAILNVNKLEAAKGRLGIALALTGGSTFAAGKHQLLVLTFALLSDSRELPLINFADLPIARQVVDLKANQLKAVFRSDAEGNPMENAQFFVNQHYLDFLSRIPDSQGLDYWTAQINECGTDKLCISQRRIGVSAAFFIEQEFQQTGSFIYRLYKVGLGRQFSYAEFAADRTQVIGGPNLDVSKSAFADAFVERTEFVQKCQQYETAEAFVDYLLKLAQDSKIDLGPERSRLVTLYQSGSNTNQSRSRALQAIIEDASFKQAEYNSSFVLMEYFGYLRRDPDKQGYDFWLNVLNNREPGNYRGMVCSFITSTEYQRRFGEAVSQNNADCSH